MHKASDMRLVALLNSLTGLELNSHYPFKRLGMLPFVTAALHKTHISIQLRNDHTLHFNNKASVYRYDVVVLFFNAKGKAADSVEMSSKWFLIHEAAGIISFDAAVPKGSKLYVLCLRIHAGRNDDPLNELSSQAMRIVQAGAV